jgi:hypothetical protein
LSTELLPNLSEEIVPEIISLEISIIFYLFQISDYLTDPSDSDDADMFTSQATQGYSEGLADNELESEVSSVFGLDPSVPDLPRNHDPSGSHISPLEYSAMLKLYRSAQGNLWRGIDKKTVRREEISICLVLVFSSQ